MNATNVGILTYLNPNNLCAIFKKVNNIIIGSVLRTRHNVKPVFVSIGYKMDLKISVDTVLKCCLKYRIPEPIRETHRLSNKLRAEHKIN